MSSGIHEIAVRVQWRQAGPVEPNDGGLATPKLPTTPGVYRWVLRHEDAERQYVGEAENLARRFAHYRKPGPSQTTNIRMNDRALRTLAAGGTVDIEVATEAELIVDGRVERADLSSPFVRRFVENAVLVLLMADGVAIINGKGFGPHREHDLLR